MDRLNLLESFLSALEEGSLNKAAKRRGITQSAISQQLAQLEISLGQQLLLRTPKGVRATRAGDLVASHARELLSRYDHLRADLASLDNAVSGTFRISVSTFLGRQIVGPALLELDQLYPDLDIVMRVEDRFVDVLRENYDLAIRSGRLGETDGYARKIAALDSVLVATPAYLDQVGRPESPADMHRLKLILRREDQITPHMALFRAGQSYQAPIRVGFTADDPDLILRAVLNGSGYTRVPRMLVQEALESGQLEVVLPAYPPAPKEIFAVYPSRHVAGRQLEVVLEAITARLRPYSGLEGVKPPRPSALGETALWGPLSPVVSSA